MRVLRSILLLIILFLLSASSCETTTSTTPGGGDAADQVEGTESAPVGDDDGPGPTDRPPDEWLALWAADDFETLRTTLDRESDGAKPSRLMLALLDWLENGTVSSEVLTTAESLVADSANNPPELVSLAEAVIFAADPEQDTIQIEQLDAAYRAKLADD